MRHLICLFLLPATILLAGCGRDNPPPKEAPDVKLVDGPGKEDPAIKDPVPVPEDKKPPFGAGEKKDPAVDAARMEKYEAALAEGLTHLADLKYEEALLSFETAKAFHDTDFIRDEITKLRSRLETDRAARKTLGDIETILEKGKAEEASKLVKVAFKEFAEDREVADRLAKLSLEAEALVATGKKEDGAARFARFRMEGDAALKEDNLRAAVLAYDSALIAQEDPFLRKQADDLRARLEKYDQLRTQAAEMRKDPAQLEDALALLEKARGEWKTLQILQDIDEYTLALSKRRDALSVADFEVRGDVGAADAGRTMAEELLPHFKTRFDLVERNQLHKVVRELKLDDAFLDDPDSHRAVAKLARVKYLVLGSIRREGGVAVNARLVDARSGLIVQTAKINVPTVEDLWVALPELSKQLLMNDEEKAAYEAERIRLAARPAPVIEDAPLPPPPALPIAGGAVPPPLIIDTPVPPDFGGLKLEDFGRLAPPPPGEVLVVAPGGAPEVRVKNRLLQATLLLGDNLFRRGDYRGAHRHFEFALQLSPGEFDIQVRIDNCRPHLPPPPVVVVAPAPVVVVPAKPRVAILNFITIGDPFHVPPYLSHWTPQHLSPYFRYQYDVVDPGEVYWYMAKTGMTLRDLMDDPHARRWLGRALGVRYFVLGTIHQTASFDVNAYLLDAEFGHLSGHGRLHARNPFDLKMRLQELAHLTLMDPRERERYLVDVAAFDALLLKGRACYERRDFTVAITIFENARKLRPHHVEVITYLEKSRHGAHLAHLEAERQRQFLAQKALEEEARRRRWELAREAEVLRVGIVSGPAPVLVDRREAASVALVKEAHLALKFKNFSLSITKFESALALAPVPQRDVLFRDLAFARSEAEKQRRIVESDQAALREAQLQRQREAELAKAQAFLKEQQRLAELAVQTERKAQAAKDEANYRAAFDEGQRLLVKGDYDGAISALQMARRYKKSDAVEAMLSQAFVRQTEKTALEKGEKERQELEKKLTLERERRKSAELEAKRNQDLYKDALALAHKALDKRDYDLAQSKFEEAGKLFKTDAVLTGLKRTETGRVRQREEKEAVARKAKEAAERDDRLKKLIIEGITFLEAKAYKKAADSFLQAKGLAPDNIEVLTGLTKAQQEQERVISENRRKTEEAGRQKEFERLVKTGQGNLDAKQFEAATLAFQEALKLKPGDPATKALLDTAEKNRTALLADAKAKAQAEKKAVAYQKHFAEGKAALEAGRFDDAIKAFSSAQKVLPGDRSSADYLAEARSARKKAEEEVQLATRKRAEELQRATDLKKAIGEARTALANKDLAMASKAIALASKLDAKHAEVLRLQRDLRQAEDVVRVAAEAEKKLRADYVNQVDRARALFKTGQFDEALKVLAQANTLLPEGKEGLALAAEIQKARTTALKAGEEKTRLAQVEKLVANARAAIKSGDLDRAGKLLTQADKLASKDESVFKAFQELRTAQATLDGKRKDEALYQDIVRRGEKALLSKNFPEAARAFEQALKFRPGDLKVQQAYRDAIEGQTKLQYGAAIDAGNLALKTGKFEDAVKAFTQAQSLMPGDAEAIRLLAAARKAWDDSRTATADLAKRKAAYEQAIGLADKALKAKQYDVAVQQLSDALKLMPGDVAASRMLKETQKAWDDSKSTSDLARKKMEYDQFVAAGQKAAATKQFDQAVKLYGDALKLFPGDAQAGRFLKETQKAWEDAKVGAAADSKLKASFQQAMQLGNKAMGLKKYAEAVAAFSQASKLIPTDATAQTLLRQAQLALENERRTEQELAKKREEETKIQTEVAKLLREATIAREAKRLGDAQKLYAAVLKLAPGQPDAARGLAEVTRAIDAAKTPTPDPKKGPDAKKGPDTKKGADPKVGEPKTGADALIKAGLALEKQAKWLDALKTYQEAAKVSPKDPNVLGGLKRAEFNYRVTEAHRLMTINQYPDAIRHLEAALTLFPGNPAAIRLLDQAKKGKK